MTSMNVIIPPGNRPPFITVPLVISTTRLLLSFDDRRHHKLAWPIVGRVGLLHLVVAKKGKKIGSGTWFEGSHWRGEV